MDEGQKKALVSQVESLRVRADAMMVLGITADGFFYSVDDRLPLNDIERLLRESAPQIRAGVDYRRTAKANH
jgi:hypothetical protein